MEMVAVMENKHMVDGDGGGDDGDEEALEIPLSRVEIRIQLPPKKRLQWWWRFGPHKIPPPRNRVFSNI
jgi:hypothetical protein